MLDFKKQIIDLLNVLDCTKFGAKILIDAQIMAQNRNFENLLSD